MLTYDEPTPVIKVTQQQLECVKCGAQTHATCSCGVNYRPIEIAKEYIDSHPSASIREIQQETGVSFPTAQRAKAKAGVSGDTPTVGRDGKSYPARKVEPGGEIARLKRLYGEDLKLQPIQQELKDVAVRACAQMNLTTLQAFALDFDQIYSTVRNKGGA